MTKAALIGLHTVMWLLKQMLKKYNQSINQSRYLHVNVNHEKFEMPLCLFDISDLSKCGVSGYIWNLRSIQLEKFYLKSWIYPTGSYELESLPLFCDRVGIINGADWYQNPRNAKRCCSSANTDIKAAPKCEISK